MLDHGLYDGPIFSSHQVRTANDRGLVNTRFAIVSALSIVATAMGSLCLHNFKLAENCVAILAADAFGQLIPFRA